MQHQKEKTRRLLKGISSAETMASLLHLNNLSELPIVIDVGLIIVDSRIVHSY